MKFQFTITIILFFLSTTISFCQTYPGTMLSISGGSFTMGNNNPPPMFNDQDPEHLVEIDDFETANIMDTIRSGHYEEISLTMYQSPMGEAYVGPLDGNLQIPTSTGTVFLADNLGNALQDNGYRTVYEFSSVTGQLVSENISTSVDGTLSVSLEFKDYLNRKL